MLHVLSLIIWLIFLANYICAESCVNMWDANKDDINICPVNTVSGDNCQFPYSYDGDKYYCIAGQNFLPRCITTRGAWSNCIVPTDAYVMRVSTVKDGTATGASLNGGTMVWITGQRFAESLFSTTVTSQTSNKILLTGNFKSYECEIHTDKTTSTQITCYTPPLPAGDYLVRVIVNGNYVPLYQYFNANSAKIQVYDSYTPKITNIQPFISLPQSFVDITGDFQTSCVLTDNSINIDNSSCSLESTPRIKRIYFGGQLCELIDPETNELYTNMTSTELTCLLTKAEVGYFNASILVNNQFGRSLANKNLFYVSPDDNLFNYQTYAEIDSVSPQQGGILGGTYVTINGKYFYDDINVPSRIDIGGQPCELIKFDMTDLPFTKFICKSPPQIENNTLNEFYGNRGINLLIDSIYTTFSNLSTAVPSSNATFSVTNRTVYYDTNKIDVTIWFKGFFSPQTDSFYEFIINANGGAIVYLSTNGTSENKEIVSSTQSGSVNKKVKLEANKNYYFEVISSKKSGGLNLEVNAKMYQTNLIGEMTSHVEQSEQEIEISSTITPAVYLIQTNQTQSSSYTSTSEVQYLEIKSELGTLFRLKFSNAATVLLKVGLSADLLQTALNDLPSLSPDLVTVFEMYPEDNSTIQLFSIEFSSDMGNVELIEEILGQANITISENTTGISSGNKIKLAVGDSFRSKPFTLNLQELRSALNQVFDFGCPYSLLKGDDVLVSIDFESNSYDYTQDNNTAFCGRSSLSNSNYIYLNTQINFRYFCFAYKSDKSIQYVNFLIYDTSAKSSTWRRVQYNGIDDSDWHYYCIDLLSSLNAQIYTSNARVSQIYFGITNYKMLYFDAVTCRNTIPFGYDDKELVKLRRASPLVQINYNSLSISFSNNQYRISISPARCRSILPYFSIENNQNTTIDEVNPASPRVTGTFKIDWDSKEILDIPADIPADLMEIILQKQEGLGTVKIERFKDCYGYKWNIKWLSGGSKSLLNIKSNTLNGRNVNIVSRKIRDGYAIFKPIRDDMLRTLHDKPQVTVSISNIMSRCSNLCDYVWDSSLTPIVNSINKNDLNAIVISGSGFDTNRENNLVKLGDYKCDVTQATHTQIIAKVGNIPFGEYNFTVNVVSNGLAQMNDNPTVKFYLKATSFNPSRSGTGGGILLNITGTGFSKDVIVTVDSNECKLTFVSLNLIICQVPPSSAVQDTQVDVVVQKDDCNSTISNQFTYDYANTPIVSSVSPNVLTVENGFNIKISGTNLPINPLYVRIGDENLNILSSSNSEIIVEAPRLPPGLYELRIPTNNLGFVLINQKIEYKLYVSSFTPNIGSIRGGTFVTVYGDGFSSNCDLNQVTFGTQECKVLNCTNTWIQCQTSSAYIVHQVNNSASDPYYGMGYSWSKPYLTINKGDSVKWSWRPPKGIQDVKFQVIQVENAEAYNSVGFNSGPASAVGSYEFQFNKPGVFYYWSGYVESSEQITFRGVVEVLDSVDKELEINVNLNGFNAQKCSFPFNYNSIDYDSCTNVDFNFDWCSPSSNYTGQIIKCNPIENVTLDNCSSGNLDSCNVTLPGSNYNMLFTTCQNNLPFIKSISSNNLTFDQEITIHGSGFSENSCENQVFIGEVECPLFFSSTDKLICKLTTGASNLLINTKYQLNLLVKNIGFANYNESFQLMFSPSITSMSPNLGSIAGGTLVTLEGYGFSQYMSIAFESQSGEYQFYISEIVDKKFQKIIFKTPAMLDEVFNVHVYSMRTEVLTTNQLTFTYSTEISPKIDSVYPLEIDTSSLITIDGINFGNESSNVSVRIGSEECEILNVNETEINCQLNGLNLGPQNILVNINGIGYAHNPNEITIKGETSITNINPLNGSIFGGTVLKIEGNGFNSTSTLVWIQIDPNLMSKWLRCKLISVSINKITCQTIAQNSSFSSATFRISTGSAIYLTNDFRYSYSQSLTPIISSVSNITESSIHITGTGFESNSGLVKVYVGDSNCEITTINQTQIECNLPPKSAGSYPVNVLVDNYGYSNSNIKYLISLMVYSLSQLQGSIGGGLRLTINGTGFSSNTKIKICNNTCIVTESSFNSINCIVPSAQNKTSDTICTVLVTENGLNDASQQFTYSLASSPVLNSLSPLRGGTGGGTLLTISGTNFPTNRLNVNVTIADTICDVDTITTTEIKCYTNSYSKSSTKALVKVFVIGNGFGINNDNVQFEYIDMWSSPWTWGGASPPGEGEIAVIERNQQIYFDVSSTPQLKGIIIQGGSLIFDDNQDVSLNVEYIIITEGGRLQIGTKEKPFQHKAVITMFGHVRSIELPIFGCKVLGLRNGTIDMHGLPVGVTWTHLNQTAYAGSSFIVLKEPVIWPLNSQIVIATTGDKFSPGQSEVRRITDKSPDNRTLTLESPLKYTHLNEKRTVGSGARIVEIYIRAEVGLFTRNVIFQGHNDDSWAPLLTAPACPSGFDPSEFAVQTCFLGRYGPELGTDQFGATIMISGGLRKPNEPERVIARFSNVEFFHVGQAFRLGRYPIHFHMNGDSPSSYVSECSMHESFNRATNMHSTNYVTIDRNVIYDIMGGAYFLEDGIEIGNVYKYNLAIFVKPSSSSINEDLTPAAFWATNPNNTYIHNAIAGCSHFGYWYRLLENPDGPSFTPNYFPRRIPMGIFYNNSAHSTGRFGLWVFPQYTPTVDGRSLGLPKVAIFSNFVSYFNDKGAEFVDANNVQFRNFMVWDQYSVGIETKTVKFNQQINTFQKVYFYNDRIGPVIGDSIIIGNSKGDNNVITKSGIVVAWDRGELFLNVSFYNFPSGSHGIRATEIKGRCESGCGGWTNQFRSLYFDNVRFRVLHRWKWDFVAEDLDGTLTDIPNGGVVVYGDANTINNPTCSGDSRFLNGVKCSSKKTWIRMTYAPPEQIPALITDIRSYTTSSPFTCFRLTQQGVMFNLEVNSTYTLVHYSNPKLTKVTEIGYVGFVFGLKPYDYLIINHPVAGRKPDKVYLIAGSLSTESLTPLDPQKNKNGDWYWYNDTKTLSFILKNGDPNSIPSIDLNLNLAPIFCLYPGCIEPKIDVIDDQTNITVKRPADALFWSQLGTWQKIAKPNWGGYLGNGSYALPSNNDNVLIPNGTFVVVDCVLPKLKNLQIDGVLEFDNGRDHYLEVDMILIKGGQLIIGWEDDPILTDVKIVFTGELDKVTIDDLPPGFDEIRAKGMGVFGSLDIHGKPKDVIWTSISETVLKGSYQIKLAQPVDWQPNDEIIITTTSFSPAQSEVLKIDSLSSDNRTLRLKSMISSDHIAYSESLPNGQSYTIAARVGLLTHNVKLIGGEYPKQQEDQFGFKLRVGVFTFLGENNQAINYKGAARITNAQMIRVGQMKDIKCDKGISFGMLGENTNLAKFSYFKNNAFSWGFACGLGVDGVSNLLIDNNVIFHNSNPVVFKGQSNLITKNLIISNANLAEAKFMGDSIIAEDNFLAGTSFVYRGDFCPNISTLSTPHSIKRNTVYAGSAVVNGHDFMYEIFSLKCIRMTGFTVYKSTQTALNYKGAAELIIELNTLIDNQIGVFGFIIEPFSIRHEAGNKKSIIRNNLIVGQSPVYSCIDDKNIPIMPKRKTFIGAGPKYDSKIGIVWSHFMDAYDAQWSPGWASITSYNAIAGLTQVTNTTFVHWGKNCKGTYDAILSTNYNNDDGQHPVTFSKIYLYDVVNSSKVWIHRPNSETINPTQCVDMDCDGLKKNLCSDLDGSFLGSPGHVFSQSEFDWGSQQRGLGDFRLPKEMLAAPNGSFIPPNQIYKYRGIVRDESLCKYQSDWQAYECHGLEYRILILESMDNDTESRRLSPIAILSDNKYVDLINGPQFHAWCMGYICQRRISTFMLIVSANKSYDIYTTSTQPNQFRFRILNSDSSFKVRLSMHYFTSQRIDLYKNDQFINASNAVYLNGRMTITDPNKNITKYMPTYMSPSGTYLYYKPDQKVYFSMDGSSVIDLKIAPVLFVRFGVPAITPDQFFNEATLVGNFAYLLGVDASKIRKVNIVRARKSSSRKKRQSDELVFLEFEIFDDPPTSLNDTAKADKIQSELSSLNSVIANKYYTGQLQDQAKSILNVTISSMSIKPPVSQPALTNNTKEINIVKIARIVVVQNAAQCRSYMPCLQQPIIKVLDEEGNLVNSLEWMIQAVLKSSSDLNARLLYQTESGVVNGYSNFTNLAITSSENEQFVIEYSFKLPEGINTSYFNPMNLNADPVTSLKSKFGCINNEDELDVVQNEYFNLTVSVIDSYSRLKIPSVAYNNFSWQAQIKMYKLSNYQARGILNLENASVSFDTSTGYAQFINLTIDNIGMYILSIKLYTIGNEFQSQCYSNTIQVIKQQETNKTNATDLEPNYKLKFIGDYYNLTQDDKNEIKANVYNYISNYNLTVSNIRLYPGSVYVVFYSPDSNSQLLNELVQSGLNVSSIITFNSANINGFTYGASINSNNDNNNNINSNNGKSSNSFDSIGSIIGGVIGGFALIVILIFVFLFYREFKKRNQNAKISPPNLLFVKQAELSKPFKLSLYKSYREDINNMMSAENL